MTTKVRLSAASLGEFFLSNGHTYYSIEFGGYKEQSAFGAAALEFYGVNNDSNRRKVYCFWRRNKDVRDTVKRGGVAEVKVFNAHAAPIKWKQFGRRKGLLIAAGWKIPDGSTLRGNEIVNLGNADVFDGYSGFSGNVDTGVVTLETVTLAEGDKDDDDAVGVSALCEEAVNNIGDGVAAMDVETVTTVVTGQLLNNDKNNDEVAASFERAVTVPFRKPIGELEGEFHFNNREWRDIFRDGKFVRTKWTHVLCDRFATINPYCVPLVKDHRVSKRQQKIIVRAYCKHRSCKKFTIILHNPFACDKSDVLVRLYSVGSFNHGKEKLLRPLSGIKREEARKELVRSDAYKYRKDSILRLDDGVIERGNISGIHSHSVLRRVRMEGNASGDYCANPMLDVYQMYVSEREEDRYIQFFGFPMVVHCFLRSHIEIIASLPSSDKPILYFDATGSVVKPFPGSRKRVLYYAGVVNIRHVIAPVIEMVTSSHNTDSIANCLTSFNYQAKVWTGKRKSLFKAAVCDFSFAIIHALVFSFQRCTLTRYLEIAYEEANGRTVSVIEVPVYICCAHFMRIVVRKLSQSFDNKINRAFLRDVVALLVRATSLGVADRIMEGIIILLCCAKADDNQINVINSFKDLISKNPPAVGEDLVRIEEESEESKEPRDRLYKKSPFFRRYHEMHMGFNDLSRGEDNPFYNPRFFNWLLKRLIPFLPLWSNVLCREKEESLGITYSNASVERWFGLIKKSVLRSQLRLTCGRFIRAVRPSAEAAMKEIRLGIPATKKQVSVLRRGEDPTMEREKWGKRQRRQRTDKGTSFEGVKILSFASMEKTRLAVNNACPIASVADRVSSSSPRDPPRNVWRTEGLKTEIAHPPLSFGKNGLVCDAKYFESNAKVKVSYVMGYVGNNASRVHLEDFLTLTGRRWLVNFIIDSFARVVTANNANVEYITCEVSQYAIEGKLPPGKFAPDLNLADKILLMPYNEHGNHWCLFYVNFREKTISFLDPKCQASETTYFSRCLTALRNRARARKEEFDPTWRYTSLDFPRQRDCYNCGIYVCYYIAKLANGTELGSSLDPTKYRVEAMRIIVEGLKGTNDICPLCDRTGLELNATWVSCDLCSRWFHIACVKKSFSKAEMEKETWICILCSNWLASVGT